jgi:hypothetical protein
MKFKHVFLVALVGLALRILLDFLLYRDGYFYGKPWDTFTRTYLAWQWARNPYFAPADYFWLPLQFWLVGLAFRLIAPWMETSSLIVPVAINHLLLGGSLAITYWVATKLGGRLAGWLSVLLAVTLTGDVWVTYSALSEPLSIFLNLGTSALLLTWKETNSAGHKKIVLMIGLMVFLASATHYVGWFLSLFMILFFGGHVSRRFASRDRITVNGYRYAWLRSLMPYGIAFALILIFPLYWLYLNWAEFGNSLHFASLSAAYQASYAGQRSWLYRSAAPFLATWENAPGLIVSGTFSVPLVLYWKGWHWGVYLLPALFNFLVLAASSALALSAPDQEPRYMVMYIWVLLPFVASIIVQLLSNDAAARRVLGLGLAAFLLVLGTVQSFSYFNSFDANVRLAGLAAGRWLVSHGESERIVIEDQGFAERMVIPIVAGYPDRFVPVSGIEMLAAASGQSSTDSQVKHPLMTSALWIIRSKEIFQSVEAYVSLKQRFGSYRFVTLAAAQ